MPLFKSWRSKASLKTLKDNSSVLGTDNRDLATDFGPQPTNYGDGKSRKSQDKARSRNASKNAKGVSNERTKDTSKPGLGSMQSSQSVTRPGKNGSPPITPKSPARQNARQGGNGNGGDDSNDSHMSKLSNVVATGPAVGQQKHEQQQQHQQAPPSSSQQPQKYVENQQTMSTSPSGMTRTTSQASELGDGSGSKPRPSELFAGKGVQWDAVKLAGPGSAPAEQNRPAAGSNNNEDLQQFLKARRQWRPQFAGTEDPENDALRFQPPKDLNKLTFGTAESQMPSRGLMSLDDLEKSHSRKQQLLEDQPLGGGLLEPVDESSQAPIHVQSAIPASSSTLSAATATSTASPPKQGRTGLASAFNFTRKTSASSVKRKESSGSTKKAVKGSAPPVSYPTSVVAAALPSGASADALEQKASASTATTSIPQRSSSSKASDPSVGHPSGAAVADGQLNGNRAHATAAHGGATKESVQTQRDITSNGHSTAVAKATSLDGLQASAESKPDYASGNLDAAPGASAGVSENVRPPDLASGNLDATAASSTVPANAMPITHSASVASQPASATLGNNSAPGLANDPLDPLEETLESSQRVTMPGGVEAVMAPVHSTEVAPTS